MIALLWFGGVVAALSHVLFFVLESLLWTRPVVRRAFGLTAQQAEASRLLALNQGFDNLFLAAGAGAGLVAMSLGHSTAGRALPARPPGHESKPIRKNAGRVWARPVW